MDTVYISMNGPNVARLVANGAQPGNYYCHILPAEQSEDPGFGVEAERKKSG